MPLSTIARPTLHRQQVPVCVSSGLLRCSRFDRSCFCFSVTHGSRTYKVFTVPFPRLQRVHCSAHAATQHNISCLLKGQWARLCAV